MTEPAEPKLQQILRIAVPIVISDDIFYRFRTNKWREME